MSGHDPEPDEPEESEEPEEPEEPEDRPATRTRPTTVWRARRPRGGSLVVTVVALLVAAAALGFLVWPQVSGWFGGDDDLDVAPDFLDYCEQVEAQQERLSQVDGDTPGGLVDALPSFEALQAEAPDDIADDWGIVVGRLDGLVEALDAAGVEAEEYDEYQELRADLDPDDRRAVEAAVRRLFTPETVAALENVQQQARDVCRVPLTL